MSSKIFKIEDDACDCHENFNATVFFSQKMAQNSIALLMFIILGLQLKFEKVDAATLING